MEIEMLYHENIQKGPFYFFMNTEKVYLKS